VISAIYHAQSFVLTHVHTLTCVSIGLGLYVLYSIIFSFLYNYIYRLNIELSNLGVHISIIM